MSCVTHQPDEPTNGRSEIVISFIASETTTISNGTDNPAVSLAEEMHRRAETITAVLEEIMHEPGQIRFWGLNE